jgi:hypothetical protein
MLPYAAEFSISITATSLSATGATPFFTSALAPDFEEFEFVAGEQAMAKSSAARNNVVFILLE